jgi:hypothetical protein
MTDSTPSEILLLDAEFLKPGAVAIGKNAHVQQRVCIGQQRLAYLNPARAVDAAESREAAVIALPRRAKRPGSGNRAPVPV